MSKSCAALSASSLKNLSSVSCCHSLSEAVNLASLFLLGLICSKHIYTSDVYFNFNLLTKSQIGTSYYNIKHPVLSTVILIFLSLKSTKYDDFVLQRRVFNDCNGKLDVAGRRQRLRSFVIVVKKREKLYR